MESAATSINWSNLISAIQNDECILVLGPNIATIERQGQTVSIQDALAQYLAAELQKIQPGSDLINNRNLAYVSKQLEDALLPQFNYKEGRARTRLGELISQFYEKYDISDFPVYEALAKLPFRFILNTCPDNFLLEAFFEENKFDAKSEFYHYRNPGHNNAINTRKAEISRDAPLVFNLFGSVEKPDSMIITETDQLSFLDTILQQENTAGIPNKIAMEFTSSREQMAEKTFVFLGFDFNQWHLRLLLHLINRYQKQKETYVLQNPNDLSELTNFFYRRNFEVGFVDFELLRFANKFRDKLADSKPVAKDETLLHAFLMYDEKDESLKNDLDTHLAVLKENAFIQTWDESNIAPGADRAAVIGKYLKQADIILLLVSPYLFVSDEIYKNKLQLALQRHANKEAVLIPILVKSCLWEASEIGKLPTILPRDRTPLDLQENKYAALTDTIQQLEGWCEKIYKRKKRRS